VNAYIASIRFATAVVWAENCQKKTLRWTMIVLTQNIWGGGPLWRLRCKPLARLIARLRPDIIGLQEVHARGASGESSQAHELADRVQGYQVIFAPGRVTPSGRCEGLAVLSRYSIREHSVKTLCPDRRDVLDRFGPRVVLRTLVELPEGPVDVSVTHLSLSRRAREQTVPELLDFAADERSRSASRGAILMGDLNAGPREGTIAMLEAAHWVDLWKRGKNPSSRGGTFPAFAPYHRIDYLLVKPQDCWEVHRCERQPFSGSDHRGVAAWLRLRTALIPC
jgi:endonuclease/exonuclease/phosphatase family metal-dependent hydrolase